MKINVDIAWYGCSMAVRLESWIIRKAFKMFVVTIATPDGVNFLSAHDNEDDARASLHDWMAGKDEENWGWITETKLFVKGG